MYKIEVPVAPEMVVRWSMVATKHKKRCHVLKNYPTLYYRGV